MKQGPNDPLPEAWWKWVIFRLLQAGVFLLFAVVTIFVASIALGEEINAVAWWRTIIGWFGF